ncbi:LamB/YcsF family protein [Rossellomorea vietnamensis]|uniref:5-oxoprolinase subunit A n=1 Tax=Rossellomorea vietnamensis TaxID=218284 RepID=A0A5D4MIW9_9BACI|nr:5-oxoprolinase subunit PxpA [Rossellomorea vietnamensis]TYS01537.1 LamB/YcsF family protein [Rossellomorea vietnamensis]
MINIDLNCDLGESFGSYSKGNDEEILKRITSANIACGFHAGDPEIMLRTVQLALKNGVKIGAHPGYPDLQGFGRRHMDIPSEEIYSLVLYQIGALEAIVRAQGGSLSHVKPHGALYNRAAKDVEIARSITKAVHDFNPFLTLFGLANSYLITAGEEFGLHTASEVFADRTYQNDGTLTPRHQEGAVIHNDTKALSQVVKMVKEHKVISTDGMEIEIKPDTICLHGDNENALLFADKILSALKDG